MKNIFYWIPFLLLLWSCEETIEIDLDQAEPLVVIEGVITNEFRQQQIKITKTNPFTTTGSTPRVSGASVVVEDSEGTIFEFEESEPGIYLSKSSFAGEVGYSYTMRVEVEGKLYTASDELRGVPAIDSLTIQIDEEEMEDPEDEGRFYEVLIFVKEPQETEDFYLIKFFRNGVVENEDGLFVWVFDDVALGPEIDNLPAPVYYALDDTARIEMYSLSRTAYRYYLDLSSNINNDGGMFSSPPANVSTNIEGGAIGIFQVSGISIGEISL